MSWLNSERFRRHLGSRANFVGLAAAGAMAVLGVMGLSGPLWPLLVVGSYAIGAIVAPGEQDIQTDLVRSREVREIRASLKKARAQAGRNIDAAVVARIDRIKRLVTELAADVENEPHVAANWETIRHVSVEYLPATLENYLAIPRAYRRTVRSAGGKTAHHELIIQLNLLERKLSEVAENVNADRLDGMFEYGQFLETRFRDPLHW